MSKTAIQSLLRSQTTKGASPKSSTENPLHLGVCDEAGGEEGAVLFAIRRVAPLVELGQVVATPGALAKTIGLYLTQSGKEAIRLKEFPLHGGSKGYSWIGVYGAGSGEQLGAYLAMIERFKKTKRGMRTLIDAHMHQVEGVSSRG